MELTISVARITSISDGGASQKVPKERKVQTNKMQLDIGSEPTLRMAHAIHIPVHRCQHYLLIKINQTLINIDRSHYSGE